MTGYNRRMKLSILGGLTPQQFFARYWQKKPLLIRDAFPKFKDFVSLESLQALAARDDVLSHLITLRDGEWSVTQGPLQASQFRRLKQVHWSLLVQGIDQLLPQGKALLSRFDFIPHARLDDLMISYAPKGGGVGPHFDSYDVFLLQGQGHKRWQVSQQQDRTLIPDAPLRILQNFKMEHEWILGPGDMLYLPPGYAHYGIALNNCLTYSIGFRAVTYQELVTQFLNHLQDRTTAEGMYADADLQAQAHPAEISTSMIDQAATVINQISWNKADIAQFLGSYLSEPKPHIVFDAPTRPLSSAKFKQAAEMQGVYLALKSQMLFAGDKIFMNGEHVAVTGAAREVLARLADQRALPPLVTLPDAAQASIYAWYQAGYLKLGNRVANE